MSHIEQTPNVRTLVAALRRRRFLYNSERELQDGIEIVLRSEELEYERERELAPDDIIDFMVFGTVGLEVKIKGSPSEVARQLLRYAGHDAVRELVLVTGRAALAALPDTLMGKPLHRVELWRSML